MVMITGSAQSKSAKLLEAGCTFTIARVMRYMGPIERKLEVTERENIVKSIKGFDTDERDFLIRMLGLDVTELNPRKPTPTLGSLLRERVCAIFTGLWAATLGVVWNFVFHTAVGVAVSKLAAVALVHAIVWAAWTALVGPVPRVVLCFVYSSILTVSVYAWLFVQQLPQPPARVKMYTPFLAPTLGGTVYNDAPQMGCLCPQWACRCPKKGFASNTIGTDAPRPTSRWGVFPKCDVMKTPVAKGYVANEPVTKRHIAKTPVAKGYVANEPVAKGSVANEPVTKRHIANEPVTKRHIANTPVAKAPAANDPVAEAHSVKLSEAQEEIRRLINRNEGLRKLIELSKPDETYMHFALDELRR